MKYVAFATKGLEEIAARELRQVLDARGIVVHQKRIEFSYDGPVSNLKQLRTVDDVAIVLGAFKADSLETFLENMDLGKLESARGILSGFRELDNTFSVTVGVFQNKNLSREQVTQAVAEKIAQSTGWAYTPLDHRNFDVRINIDQDDVLVSVKVFPESLYKREYDHQPTPGALRSTIAAAMLNELVQGGTGLKVVDNFCGSGTFLCEAAGLGCDVYGSDINPGAVEVAVSNLQKVGVSGNICVQDAAHTKWPNQTFDIAVSNLPWDKQIEVASITQIIDGSLAEYARILKPDAKIGIISTKPEIVAKYLKKHFQVNSLREYRIGYLGQTPIFQLAEVLSR